MSSGDSMSFTATTTSGQINQGKDFTANQNTTTTGPIDLSDFFDRLRESMPENVSSELITPLAAEAVRAPMHDSGKVSTLLERIAPYAPALQKAVLAFGSGALEALASANPIVRGTLKAIQAMESQDSAGG